MYLNSQFMHTNNYLPSLLYWAFWVRQNLPQLWRNSGDIWRLSFKITLSNLKVILFTNLSFKQLRLPKIKSIFKNVLQYRTKQVYFFSSLSFSDHIFKLRFWFIICTIFSIYIRHYLSSTLYSYLDSSSVISIWHVVYYFN